MQAREIYFDIGQDELKNQIDWQVVNIETAPEYNDPMASGCHMP